MRLFELQLEIHSVSEALIHQRIEFEAARLRNVIFGFIHFGLWWRFVSCGFHNCLAFFVWLSQRLKWCLISRSAWSQSSNS